MKVLRFFGKLACVVSICVSLAGADSIALRNGRHLQGKYIGGTATTIGFMSGTTVEYFATADVVALMFDGNSLDSSANQLQPRPMRKNSLGAKEPRAQLRNARARKQSMQTNLRHVSSTSVVFAE